ncbi:MAG TPA: hypothetical protein PLI09_20485 [Candidatus Hydrogenedentes bacterium]|nr:hypothetical protein [Candidatus Hydrogenedentota bacterium]
MKHKFGLILSALALFSGPLWAEQVLGTYPADEIPANFKPPANVSVMLDLAGSTDGKGSLKVTYTGDTPVEVMFFHQEIQGVGEEVLWYEASIRGEKVTKRACLAMWANFSGGNSYFSRGLSQSLKGTKGWQVCKTPFFLKKDQTPSSVDMGLRFEGPGTVWLDNAQLVAAPRGWHSHPTGIILGVLGGLYGVLLGCWGALCGILSSRGKGRGLILASGIFLILLSAVFLVLGIYFFACGMPYDLWYPCVLSGGLVLVLMGVLLPIIMRRYRQMEAQRMSAIEQASDL